MNLPEHSWQSVEARDGGGGLLRCFSCLLPPASLCPCYSQSLPQVCLPSLHCLPASACPLLSHSHPFYSWRSWTGVPVPCICCLPCPVALSTVLLFSFSLFQWVRGLSPDSRKPWSFQGWLICYRNSDEKSGGGFVVFSKLRTWRHPCGGDITITWEEHEPGVKSRLCTQELCSFWKCLILWVC